MLAVSKLPASLSGIESLNFFNYWNVIKDKIQELQELGYHISQYQQKLGVARANLIAKGFPDKAKLLDDEIKKVQDDLDKWWKVKGYIDKYLPEWLKASQSGTVVSQSSVGNVLEALPVIITIAAITALTYVVTTGMSLLADYKYRKSVTTDVIEGRLTSGAGAELLKITSSGEGFFSKLGLGAGVVLPIIAVIGIVIYFGIEKKV